MHSHALSFSTYQDLDNILRPQQGLMLVVFVSRNRPLQQQLAAFKYLMSRHASRLPMFVLPGGYCDLERVTYNIATFPTYLFLQTGAEVGRFSGHVTGRRLEDFILHGLSAENDLGVDNRVAQDPELLLQ